MLKINRFLFLFILLATAGCATVSEEPQILESGSFPKPLRSVSQMQLVQMGMLKSEVRSLLDEKITIGYEQHDSQGQAYTPLVLNNPYRMETVKNGSKVFEIYYYFIGIKKVDGNITDDELLPVVFQNDRLVGKGWNFVDAVRRNSFQVNSL
jgi:hypothetical protein